MVPDIDSIENDAFIFEESNFAARAEAIDFIEFNVIERIEWILLDPNPPGDVIALRNRAEGVKSRLEDIDMNLFRRLRDGIRRDRHQRESFREILAKYVGPCSGGLARYDETGYDYLDTFFNGLLNVRVLPSETIDKTPGMVAFQKTPARMICEMTDRACITKEDVFFDLGSGLGQVSILVNLLSGAIAKGIEIEPSYCSYARASAEELCLPRVEFIEADAREADYSSGTVFFIYSSFEGQMLNEVLETLRHGARKKFKLFTFGPCTAGVSRQDWLDCVGRNTGDIHKLGVFERR